MIRDLYGRGNSWRCLWSALADFSWLIENYSIQTTFIADAPQLIQHPTTGLYAFARMPEATGSFRWIEVIGSTAEDNPKKWVVFQQDQQTYFKRGVRGSNKRFDDYRRTGTMTWLAEEGLAEGNSGLNGIDEMRVQVETQRVIHPRPSSLTKPLQAITLQQPATTSHMPSCHTSRAPLSHPQHK